MRPAVPPITVPPIIRTRGCRKHGREKSERRVESSPRRRGIGEESVMAKEGTLLH